MNDLQKSLSGLAAFGMFVGIIAWGITTRAEEPTTYVRELGLWMAAIGIVSLVGALTRTCECTISNGTYSLSCSGGGLPLMAAFASYILGLLGAGFVFAAAAGIGLAIIGTAGYAALFVVVGVAGVFAVVAATQNARLV